MQLLQQPVCQHLLVPTCKATAAVVVLFAVVQTWMLVGSLSGLVAPCNSCCGWVLGCGACCITVPCTTWLTCHVSLAFQGSRLSHLCRLVPMSFVGILNHAMCCNTALM
jgi:hypothetical protein